MKIKPAAEIVSPRTAVLLTGHMRSFARCLPTQIDHVYRHFPDCDFFVSTVRDDESSTAELLRERFPRARVEIEVVDCQPELPIPVPPLVRDWTVGRIYTHEPYALSVHPQAVLRQLWQLERGWQFFQRVASVTSPPADRTIIRMRPDNYFRSYRPGPVGISTACTPWWGRFGGVNDRFAVLGMEAAAAYFTTYSRMSHLLDLGYPLHPERLVYASLAEAGCQIKDTLQAEFSKLIWDHGEKHGTFRDPEISLIDLAHLSTAR